MEPIATPKAGTMESILAEADNQAGRFNWSKAAKFYTRYLSLVSEKDFAKRGENLERIGLCYYQAAMQGSNIHTSRERLANALLAYKHARKCFGALGQKGRGEYLRCQAMEAYVAYWSAGRASKKRRLLEESWRTARSSLQFFLSPTNALQYSRTYNQLSVGVAIGFEYDPTLRDRVRKLREAVEHGRRAIEMLQSIENKEELTKALVRTALFLDALSDHIGPSRQGEYQKEALQFWSKAIQTSRETAYLETSRPPLGFLKIHDQNQTLAIAREALQIARRQRDNFALGWLKAKLSSYTFWAADASENPAMYAKLGARALHLAEEAAKHYDAINFTSPVGGVLWVHSPYAEHFMHWSGLETDVDKVRGLLEKSLRSTPELIRLARRSQYPDISHYAYHVSGRSKLLLAEREPDRRRKRKLLREALQHRIHAARITDQIEPRISWNRGVSLRYLADTQATLAELEVDPRNRRELLLEAVHNKEKGLKCSNAFFLTLERPERHTLRGPLGRYHHSYADLLLQLYSITMDRSNLEKAATEYVTAADWYRSIPRHERMAEVYWKAAEAYDRLQSYSFASENFTLASRAYLGLGQRVPELRELGKEYSHYLMAWSRIESAKAAHIRLQYGSASRFYYSAALLHRSTKRWNFLAPYYSAWSKLEKAESLSKTGDHEDAMPIFHEASELFLESRILLRNQLALLDQTDERTMVSKLVETPWEIYCQARVTVEEAILAEGSEDYRTSIEKFARASRKLQEVSNLSQSEEVRKETGFLSTLCAAWRLSNEAELDGSTEELRQACEFFERAKKMSPSQTAMKLAQGHEAFCKALIASREFADTLDPRFREEASRQLDLASGCYLDSGFKSASDQAVGRKLLLDASARLNSANSEPDQKKKAGLYRTAAALLHQSALAFRRARQPGKMEKVRGLLAKAKMESKIATDLTEILDATLGAPTNVAFLTPAQGDEEALGLGRSGSVDVDVRLAKVAGIPRSEKEIELKIEITNTGKETIRVVRVEEAIPDGTDLREAPEAWMVQGRSLTAVQSRRIDPLQTETIREILRPQKEGLLKLRPKIVFTDASGATQERAMEPRLLATSRILEFLANCFARDYDSKRLAVPDCGWRTLMEIVNDLKIPRSHVYGEPRYGRTFGRQLEALVNSSLVQYRIFSGERGRGGDITKVRVLLNNDDVRRYIQELAPSQGGLDPFSWSAALVPDNGKGQTQIAVTP